MSRTGIILLLIPALAACGILGGGDEPAIPGKIVFSAIDDSEDPQFQLFTMNADGSGVRQLTEGEFFATSPAWSPDGSRIAFASNRQAFAGFTTLWVMDADGGNPEPLARHPQTGRPIFGDHPAWSPDGTTVAFDQCINCEAFGSNHEVFLADLQAGTIDTLVRHPASDRLPTWSPDGQRIAFVSDRAYFKADTLRFRADIYSVKTDGSNLKRVTETGFARNPVWNPNGNTIGFRSSSSSLGLFQTDIQSGNILEIELDLSSTIQLFPMAWSSDGLKLLVTARDQSKPQDFYIYIVDIKKKEVHSIPYGPKDIMDADWFTSPENQN